MKNTVPNTVPMGKTKAVSNTALPLPTAGDPGGTRTPNNQFRSIPPLGDVDKQTSIYSVLTLNSTDVQVYRKTSADIHTVPNTVPLRNRLIQASTSAPTWNRLAWQRFIARLQGVR